MEPGADGMVLVMGATGAGKSTFINTLKPGAVRVSHGLESTQQPPRAVQLYLDEDEKCSVTVVDTPGFNDTYRENAEILAEITEYLAAQYALKIPLRGIIYLHQIHETKMTGPSRKFVEMFQAICGEEALKKVTLVTTRWDCVPAADRGKALRREQELLDTWWRPMRNLGSTATQFHGSCVEAEALVLGILQDGSNIVLDIQRELVDGNKRLAETKAGLPLDRQLEAEIERHETELKNVEARLVLAQQWGTTDEVKALRSQKKDKELTLKNLRIAQGRIRTKVGEKVKDKVSERRRRNEMLASSVSVFAAMLSITLTVVKFVALGGAL